MKELFRGFYKLKDYELIELWDNAFITFDTNVLLNLYRYSVETRNALFKLLNNLSTKIFLTYQVGLEFHQNRFDVIIEQERLYKSSFDALKKIEDDFNSKARHPFISDKLGSKLKEVVNDVKTELKNGEKDFRGLIHEDEIYEQISYLFKDKVQEAFSKEEIEQIIREGVGRYANKIPPGFEDEKNKTANECYGDLILWKGIIEFAKKERKAIIFVTEERKKDWWWISRDGQLLGPRQELVNEIYREAEVDFQMCSIDSFFEIGLKYLKEKANLKAISEIKELSLEPTYKNVFSEVLINIDPIFLSPAFKFLMPDYRESFDKEIERLRIKIGNLLEQRKGVLNEILTTDSNKIENHALLANLRQKLETLNKEIIPLTKILRPFEDDVLTPL